MGVGRKECIDGVKKGVGRKGDYKLERMAAVGKKSWVLAGMGVVGRRKAVWKRVDAVRI